MTVQEIKQISEVADLKAAYEGSYYFIAGCGTPEEWVSAYNDLLVKREIGRPVEWIQTTGAAVNLFASEDGTYEMYEDDLFPLDLSILMFPLDGLASGSLPIFKIQMGDRWFDDVIQNMRRRG